MIDTIISRREREVLKMISYEYRSREIAKELFISIHTVQTHRRNLLEKFNVKNVAGLIRKGFEMGYLQMEAMV